MRTPSFWFTPPDAPTLAAKILSPLGRIYAAATARRLRQPGQKMPVPAICVGNLNAGGTGKTPTAIALIARLIARGASPHIVSRGHGGRLTGPVRVDLAHHSAADVGDEPLLLARVTQAPVWVARDRAAGARAAVTAGASVVVLDDGFQNPSLVKSLSIIVVDAHRGFGNGLCLPAGPLREPVQTGLKRADLVLSIGDTAAQQAFERTWGSTIDLPHLRAQLVPMGDTHWPGRKVVAFAGIGHPDKFFATLSALGAEVVETVPMGDHEPLSTDRLNGLLAAAKTQGAQLVTTEKDLMRLPSEWQSRVLVLPVRLDIEDPAPLDRALDRIGC